MRIASHLARLHTYIHTNCNIIIIIICLSPWASPGESESCCWASRSLSPAHNVSTLRPFLSLPLRLLLPLPNRMAEQLMNNPVRNDPYIYVYVYCIYDVIVYLDFSISDGC